MDTNKKSAENRLHKFNCDFCHYFTNKKSDYDRHLLTPKHERLTNPNENAQKSATYYTCKCGNDYKHMSSFCKHKKTCNGEKMIENTEPNTAPLTSICDKDIIIMLMKQNTDLIKELCAEDVSGLKPRAEA